MWRFGFAPPEGWEAIMATVEIVDRSTMIEKLRSTNQIAPSASIFAKV
jgi:hypothetical protein